MPSYTPSQRKRLESSYAFSLLIFLFFLISLLGSRVAYAQTITLDELKAFPTAEGYGKHVTGGKDGIILKVTNLNDRGNGSLRAALEDDRAATIIFEVAGTILLNSSIVSKSNKTVAGETAFRNGGQGISIRMNPNQVFSNPLIDTGGTRLGAFGNHIWRFIRFRRGQGVSGENSGDNFSPWGNAGRFIMDHCSFMFSTDQNVSFPSINGYTVQNSISAFGLAYATHAYGTKHSTGSLTSDTPYCTWYRNLFSCNDDRNPLIQARSTGITRVELINNFIYNRGIFGVQLQTFYGGAFHADVIGNYFKDGPNSNTNRWGFMWPGETTAEADNLQYYRNPDWNSQRVYVSGNLSPRRVSHNEDNWNILGRWDDNANAPQTSKNQHQVQNRLNDGVSNTAILAAEELQSEMLSDVGVSLYHDSFDAQAISFARNGTGSIVNGNGYTGGNFPEMSVLGPHPYIQHMSSVPPDADDDGIDDEWANTHDVSSSSHVKEIYNFGDYQVINNAGYSALEIYLAYLSKDFDRMEKGNENVTIPVTSLEIDLDVLQLNNQETRVLTASVTPSNATNQTILWSSSNTAIATVDQSGNVTAVIPGSTTITATAADGGGASVTVQVNVIPAQPTEIWLEAECAEVGANWSVLDDDAASGAKYLLPPVGNNYTEAPSDTGSIIKFDFAATAGTYKIYTRALTPNGMDDSFWVRVNEGEWLLWNKIPASNDFQWNQVHQDVNVAMPLTFELLEGANTLQIAHREDGAALDKVFITNTATVPNEFGQTDDSCAPVILVNGITLNPKALDLEIDQTWTLTTTVLPSNATNQNIIWSSNNMDIATIDQNGNVTAISEGRAILTAAATDDSEIFDTAEVHVVGNPAQATEIWLEAECAVVGANWSVLNDASVSGAKYLLPPVGNNYTEAPSDTGSILRFDFSVTAGTYKIFTRALTPNGADDSFWVRVNEGEWLLWNEIPASNDFQWNQVHQNDDIALPLTFQLPEGANTLRIAHREDGAALDKVFITNLETLPQEFGQADDSCSPDIIMNEIMISPKDLVLDVNQVQTLTANISPTNATNQTFTWASSDTNIASVNQSGIVTAVSAGLTTITATANGNSEIYDTAEVTVVGNPTEIWLEAECASVGANWSVLDDASVSGAKYLLPPVGNNYTEAPSDTGSILRFDFSVTAGTYKIFTRAFTPNGADDSFWVRVNEGEWLLWNEIPASNDFQWNQVHQDDDVTLPLTFELLEGANSLQIAHREDGAALDKVFITNLETVPQELGQADDSCSKNEELSAKEITGTRFVTSLGSGPDQNYVLESPIVSPNPTRNIAFVRFPKESEYSSFSLHSLNGALIEVGEIDTGQREVPITLSTLPNGVYVLRLANSEGDGIVKKIVKQ